MKSVQITLDDETLRQLDLAGKPLGLKRSEIIRRALSDWLLRQEADGFEREWIDSLQTKPDKAGRAEDWTGTQTWRKK